MLDISLNTITINNSIYIANILLIMQIQVQIISTVTNYDGEEKL